MKYLLDTCVLSELVKPSPSAQVVQWIDAQEEHHFFLSVLTLGELEKGVARLDDGARKQTLQAWITHELPARFNGRILDVNEAVARCWGALQAEAEKRGKPMPVIDGLLAATAKTNDLVVVTRNNTDLEASGVPLHNPWS